MKIKARDLIPGWPRGRSTNSIPYVDHGEIMVSVCGGDFPTDDDRRQDFKGDIIYHRQQAEMIDKYRRGVGPLVRYWGEIYYYAEGEVLPWWWMDGPKNKPAPTPLGSSPGR